MVCGKPSRLFDLGCALQEPDGCRYRVFINDVNRAGCVCRNLPSLKRPQTAKRERDGFRNIIIIIICGYVEGGRVISFLYGNNRMVNGEVAEFTAGLRDVDGVVFRHGAGDFQFHGLRSASLGNGSG